MIIPKESAIGYYVLIRMELLTPLPVFLEGNPLNDALMVKFGSDICRALEYCEGKNVIHRDIKPANIFVNRFGDFKLGDFGIARSMSSANTLMTQRGTERYMAPEIYRGGQYGFQVDIYSLGLVLYQYLNNNRPPFCTQNDISYSDYRNALNRRIRGDVIPPPLYGSEELKRAVLRAVEYRPEDRFATAAEFREALQKAIELPGGVNKEPGAGDEIIRADKKTNRETKKQQHTAFLILGAMCVILFMSFAAIIGGRMFFGTDENDSDTVLTADENDSDTTMTADENDSDTAMTAGENNSDTVMTADEYDTETALTEAESLAASYDYDSAVALLEEQRNFDKDPDIIAAISKYTTLKSTLEAKDVTMVPNIIYQSLIVDPDRAYDASLWDEEAIIDANAWRITIDEFDRITQQMYDNGWVLVSLRDLVTEKENADGTVTFENNHDLLLPPDKKPFVLSVNNWNYYHSYEGRGCGDKAVIDEDGLVKIQYTDKEGKVSIGDYDVMPRLNTFLREHPDGAYKGARGIAAVTGYNGVLGYRTDPAYKTGVDLEQDQLDYLEAHPDFNWDEEVAEAKKVADACKEEGWEFACHSWGHMVINKESVETIAKDNEKWRGTVQSIVGKTDILSYSRNYELEDISQISDRFDYFMDNGFRYFIGGYQSNADKWLVNYGDHVWQNRINIDGKRMWRSKTGKDDAELLGMFFDVDSVFDSRRPTPVK